MATLYGLFGAIKKRTATLEKFTPMMDYTRFYLLNYLTIESLSNTKCISADDFELTTLQTGHLVRLFFPKRRLVSCYQVLPSSHVTCHRFV
jgi:hypothetical protein